MTTKKRVLLIVAWSLLGVFLAFLAIGIYYVVIFQKILNEVTTPQAQKAVYGVYVLKADAAERIEDTAGYLYGVYPHAAGENELQETKEQLANTLNQTPDFEEYADLFALLDGLKAQTCRAILLDEAYKGSVAETEGYEWVENGIRKLESITVEQQTEKTQEPTTAADTVKRDTFLLYISGIDTYGALSTRSRSDVNILMAVDPAKRKIQLVSTPRDFYVDFNRTNGQKDKLTHAGLYGVASSMDALYRLYGVTIDYYVRINFSGFVDVIDALGGVEVYSDTAFTVAGVKSYQKGYNQVNGIEALAFARERYQFTNGDYQRSKNQMEVIKAVIRKCTSPAILLNYTQVMNGIGKSFETNMPQSRIIDLIQKQITGGGEWQVDTYTTQGKSAYRQTFSMPGRNLFVILPDASSVDGGKTRLKALLAG